MRGSECASGAKGRGRFSRGLRSLWRQPHLALPAALSALWLLAMPAYLAVTFYGAALAAPEGFIADYSWFYGAALRLFSDPATLYADPGYLYPPPAAVLFWPTTWASEATGYVLSGPLLFAGLTAAFAWALRLWERETGESLRPVPRLAMLTVALGSGPTFQNLKYAQVNVLVLLSALAFLHLCQRQRPGWGALALAGGFWLKVLPLALLPLALGRLGEAAPRAWRRLAVGAFAGWAALPLALLPLVPWALYREYALVRFPTFSGLTDSGGLSASIQATITRLDLPIEVVTQSGMLPSTPPATLLAGLVGALVVGGATVAVWAGRLGTVRSGFVVLAVLPAVVPLGWEHTFVLALPLLLLAFAETGRPWIGDRGRRRPLARWLVGLCALAFFAQRPPSPLMESLIEALPRVCIDLYLARLWLAVLVLVGVVTWGRLRLPGAHTAGSPSPLP